MTTGRVPGGPGAGRPERLRPLWRDRNFTLFWALQTLSTAGDSFSYVALPLLVLRATGSVAQMGLVTALAAGASVLTGVFAGVLVDRVDRRALMIGCDAARAVAYAAIPIAWLAGPQVWLLYLVVPLGGVFGMIFRVSYVTAVPNLVDADRITEANGRLSATYALASVGGPTLAGVVSGLLGPAAAIGVDAATFAVSALGLGLVRLRRTAPAGGLSGPAGFPGLVGPRTGHGSGRGAGARRLGTAAWRDLLVGARFLWRHPVLRALTVLLSASLFLLLGVEDVFIYHLKHDLGQPDRVVGYVLAVAAGGTALGAVAVAAVRRRWGFGTSWIGAHTLAGLAITALGVSANLVVLAALAATYSFGTAIAGICSMSLRQEVTPDHLLGRVTAAFWTIHYALAPLGAGLLTAAAARYGSAPVLVAAGAGCVVVALSGLLTPLAGARPERVGDASPLARPAVAADTGRS